MLNKLGDRLLRLLFPPKCVFCRRLLEPFEQEVCNPCLDHITLAEQGHVTTAGAFYHQAIFALWYEDAVRNALHRFKFSGLSSYARPLAKILVLAVESRLPQGYDLIVPVPTNPVRVAQRGYDHALLLARELGALTDKPVVAALTRTRETRPMYGLKPDQRRANVLGAFALSCPPQTVAGRTILLVDDILTTGSTASECASVLLEHGALRVYLAAVAAARDSHADK